MTGLRERKRERTRLAIVDAATALFEQHGYDGTTVADIAAAAEIGTRTFFGYFASKEDLLLPEADARVAAAITAFEARQPQDRPADILLRALRDVDTAGHDMVGRRAALQHRLMREVPALRGRALQLQLDAQREIARHLAAAYPHELDAVAAGALVGAFIGAVTGAVQALTEQDVALTEDERRTAMIEATDRALRPWLG